MSDFIRTTLYDGRQITINKEHIESIVQWKSDDGNTHIRTVSGDDIQLANPGGAALFEELAPTSLTVFPEIQRVAVLSTGHMTREDDSRLCTWEKPEIAEGVECKCWLTETEFGHRVRITGDDFPDEFEEMVRLGLSDAFISLLTKARAAGFHEILFDRDGPESTGFPVFDW